MIEVHTYKQTKEITPAIMDKLVKSKQESADLEMRNILCPYCGFVVEKVFSDAAGHKQVFCRKCKQEYIINLGYFRKQKHFKYFRLSIPDDNTKRFTR